ncbi:Signal recognition particle SRP9 subunit [Penicillium pulvis]|uniref:Signal recognition particle SRP9 subunit n=1 Tax=Penicillium pulvis TaxID=1562058 RepID=UPI002549AE09|nr:Signal recognition particle SRP9 subunit [Penicillium pulvis]KAJ5802913.1 Signal recognition particle SRP9 subunit [Penicillium pulvis]
MPYLPTTQAFLEQSALLLEAYPETTRITTKYSFPTERRAQQHKREKSLAKKQASSTTETAPTESTPTAPIASLTLKTYNPATGVCLKYRTNKLQEVSRLMTGLGKLAGGADVASLGLSGPGADVEMVDAPAAEEEVVQTQSGKVPAGGKGKKKGGKGKR